MNNWGWWEIWVKFASRKRSGWRWWCNDFSPGQLHQICLDWETWEYSSVFQPRGLFLPHSKRFLPFLTWFLSTFVMQIFFFFFIFFISFGQPVVPQNTVNKWKWPRPQPPRPCFASSRWKEGKKPNKTITKSKEMIFHWQMLINITSDRPSIVSAQPFVFCTDGCKMGEGKKKKSKSPENKNLPLEEMFFPLFRSHAERKNKKKKSRFIQPK